MRVVFAAIAASVFATASYSEGTVKCDDVIVMAENLNPLLETLNGISSWCNDGRSSQPACQELGRLIVANNTPERSIAMAMAIMTIGLQCPVEPE